ncbi:MAG: hypothetical protein ISS15_11735 [Alphaproteobacteria bacterium]|nr:hypothetical protein [Alphaproteobacteria bacterium]MBL7098323.1 hypothetical protein [Alphaproteobacteria bacterium]
MLIAAAAAVAASIALPFIGARNALRGYDRGIAATVFLTVISNLAIIFGGIALGAITLPIVVRILIGHSEPLAAKGGLDVVALEWSAAIALASVMIGAITGLIERPARIQAIAVRRYNDDFLLRNGIRATGDQDVTHYDPQNNPLRLMERQSDRLVFMAVSRRNRRAYISLDTEGRMVSYSGIVKL